MAFSFLNLVSFAQGETNIWYFGQLAGLDFNSGSPVALTNGALSTSEGSATICDKNGSLLFYTDGIRVWNKNHVQMPNGNGLLGDPSSALSAIIVPKPGSTTRYYIFTVAAQGNPGGFCYSEVDMALNGGLGDVLVANKNTQLFTPAVEKITAVKHANGLYVWVLAHGFTNNRYYAYLVTCNGVSSAVTSDVGQVEGWPGWGYLVASPDGTKLASAMRNIGFELLDFNNATGVVSNPVFLGNPTECYGVSFSPDNNVLYGLKINGGSIWQWNLQAGSPAAIIASMIQVGTAGGTAAPYSGGAMQLGPDGKMYITQYGQPYLSAINNPNVLGAGCNLQLNAVDLLGRVSTLGLPPFIQSYFDTSAVINTTGNCVGKPVNFTISSNTTFLDSVRWNFDDPSSGNANTSPQLTPAHTFASTGNYNVQLIRYLDCIADTSYLSVNIIGPVFTTQNVTICPGTSFTLPDGGTANVAGTYTDTIPASNSCDSIVTTNLTVASFNVDAGNNTAICNGTSTQLNATGGLIYSWTPTTNLSNANIPNPVATPSSTTTYTVSTQVEVGNAIVNGDFSAGNTGFSSSYVYKTPPNTTEGQYWVSNNAQVWNGGMAPCGDHTTGSGNMLLVNGATVANVSIWCQTVNVLPNTTYAFSTWLASLTAGNPAQLQFSINGSLLGSVFTASNTTCLWQQFYTTWNSGSNTTANICIVNQNTIASANDFAIDDISFAQLCTATDTVVITVHPTYSNTVNSAICQNEVYVLPDGSTTTTAGTYVDTLTTLNGCDSVVTTNLTVHPTYSYSISQTICPSDMYLLPGGSMVNTTGIYVDTLNTVNGCDSIITTNLTVVPPAISVTADTAICLNSSVQLDASGGLYTYSWSPAIGLSDSSIANPVATPQQTTTYVVTTQVASGDLIGNGNFSGGNVAFTSDYSYTTNLQPEGTYYVGTNPNTYHSGFSACPDHTTGNGNMMIVNGAGTPGLNVWCQTINVVPNTNYAFSCWVTSVAAGSPAILQFSISGNLLATPFTAPGTVCQWQQFYATWNSGSNTTANICIVNQNTTLGGNDFAIDDITFIGLCEAMDSVTITVNQPSTTVIDTAICNGVTYTFPLGNTSTVSVTDTALLTDQFGCDSTVITNLTVNPTPVTNVSDTICANQSYTLPSGNTVSAAGIYTDTLTTILGCDSIIITNLTVFPVSATSVADTICAGSSYTLPNGNVVSTAGTYPVTLSNMYGCDSVVTTTLTIIQLTLSLTETDVTCFGDGNGTILATATAGVQPYQYDLQQGGSSVSTNNSGNFQNLNGGNYTVVATDDFGCTATATTNINEPTLLQSTFTSEAVSCFGEQDGTISVSANGGTPAYTYTLSTGSTNISGNFGSLSAGSYPYTVTDANGCTDTATVLVYEPMEVLVDVVPDSVTLHLGESIQLNATSNYGSTVDYMWSPSTGLSCNDCTSPTVTLYNSLTYYLTVSVDINGNSCYAYAEVPVTVIKNYDLFIPNVFTPNGDGTNDLFRLFGNLPALKFVEMQIFNRTGEKVFESNDINFTWDGSYRGKLLEPQVLVYTLYAVFIDNHSEEIFKGSLTLLR
jgi:gliding motility-associated-like protein